METRYILIVKHGALGDVVRTSYFAKSIKEESNQITIIHWWTSPAALDILRLNPYIDKIIFDEKQLVQHHYDEVYSLDDEDHILEKIETLKFKELIGIQKINGKYTYCERSKYWFDMGLRSLKGKETADFLKKKNELTHTQIFSKIFNVNSNYLEPHFYNSKGYNEFGKISLNHREDSIGINPFAGGRWKSKELLEKELHKLINYLLDNTNNDIILFGAFEDYSRNQKTVRFFNNDRLSTINTDESLLKLAGIIKNLKLLITSDSLALHLAIANGTRSISFFTPTSASEIDTFGNGNKVISTSDDYCNYQSISDNSTITAERIINYLG